MRRGRRAVHRTLCTAGADGGFAETGTPVLVIAPAETKQEAQALLQSLRETRADDAETQRLIEPFLK